MAEVDLTKARARASACIEKLSLPLSSRTWRGQAGEFAGAGVGSSIDFQDHRSYVPGDDPRHINWQAYARTGTYTMKLYREEVRPVVDVLLDVSPSMFFDADKAQRVAEVFYTVALSALQSGASLSVYLVSGDQVKKLSHELIAGEQWWEIAQEMAKASTSDVPAVGQVQLRSNAIRVWISDCLFAGDPAPLIRRLASQQGSLIVLSPYSRSEADPDWSGNYEFVDVEVGSKHPHCIDYQALVSYKQTYINHFKVWQESARRYQASFARVDAQSDLFTALLTEAVALGGLQLK
jgi:uncharacterized protein (DUF58 family)